MDGHLWSWVLVAAMFFGIAGLITFLTWNLSYAGTHAAINDLRVKIFFDALYALIGLVPLGWALWHARSNRTIRINSQEVQHEFRTLFFRRVRRIARNDVQLARWQEPHTVKQNWRGRTFSRGVEVVYRNGSFVLPAGGEAEADWLADVINEGLSQFPPADVAGIELAKGAANESPADRGTKLACPVCKARIPAANLSLKTGWAKCARCDELFVLSDLLPGYRASAVTSPLHARPFNARATIEATPAELTLRIAGTPWKQLGASAAWVCAIACLVLSTLLSAGIVGLALVKADGSSFYALPWTVPFWFVGIGLLAVFTWKTETVRTIQIDASTLTFESRWFIFRRRQRIRRDDVQCARRQDRYRLINPFDEPNPVLGVEIICRKRLILLPVESDAEVLWMIQALNDFLTLNSPRVPNPDPAGE
jgi:hypothetical protein